MGDLNSDAAIVETEDQTTASAKKRNNCYVFRDLEAFFWRAWAGKMSTKRVEICNANSPKRVSRKKALCRCHTKKGDPPVNEGS